MITTCSHNREGGTTWRYELTFVSRYVLTRVRADPHPYIAIMPWQFNTFPWDYRRLVVNTRTVVARLAWSPALRWGLTGRLGSGLLGIMPPQGCEAILIEILESKKSTAGLYFKCCFSQANKHTKELDTQLESSHFNFLLMQVFCEITHYYIFYRKFSPSLHTREVEFSLINSIKMSSQPCGGTVANRADTGRAFTANHRYTNHTNVCIYFINYQIIKKLYMWFVV